VLTSHGVWITEAVGNKAEVTTKGSEPRYGNDHEQIVRELV